MWKKAGIRKTPVLKVTFLGTGTSIGVPVIGCSCKVCCSKDKRNRRRRCSVLIEFSDCRILIDTPPDFRSQALEAGIHSLDAVFWTHSHADHLNGIDDLRPLSWKAPLQTYCSASMTVDLQKRFPYLWKNNRPVPKGVRVNTISAGETVYISSNGKSPHNKDSDTEIKFTSIPVIHGKQEIFGWRCGPMAYLTDVSKIPEDSYSMLESLDVLILGALRFESHHKHFSIHEAIREIEIIRPKRCYLTHISHEAEHRKILKAMPAGVWPAHDGLTLRIKKKTPALL